MSNDLAVDPQRAGEAGLPEASEAQGAPEAPEHAFDHPEDWREHVRELRSENARRRRENQELRGQLAALEARARAAEEAQAAARAAAVRDAARLATTHRRIKELELARLTRQALAEAEQRRAGATAARGCAPRQPERRLDPTRAQRLLELVPSPVRLDVDMLVDDEGQASLAPEAAERLRAYAEEVAELASVEERPAAPAPPPVGGQPPRPADAALGRIVNAWDPEAQRAPAARARAARRHPQGAPRGASVVDALG